MIDEAVKTEDYEKAASIRDELKKERKAGNSNETVS
jgi:protein-arginine kinase activator protein McsA